VDSFNYVCGVVLFLWIYFTMWGGSVSLDLIYVGWFCFCGFILLFGVVLFLWIKFYDVG
jgi:hypothetical protein